MKVKPGDTLEFEGKLYRVYSDGKRLRLWLISQPMPATVAQRFDEALEAQRELDAVYDDAANRGGY